MRRKLVVAPLVLVLCMVLLSCAAPPGESPRSTRSPEVSEPRSATTQPRFQGAAPTGLAGLFEQSWQWLVATQAEFTRQLASAVRALKTADLASGILVLAGLSFTYGVLHAAGPGHGKAVISSYVLADGRTLLRGIVLAFLAALIQALSAIILVGLLVVAVQATGLQLRDAEASLETASWGFVAVVGAWMLYRQLKPMVRGCWHRLRHTRTNDEAEVSCETCLLPDAAAFDLGGSWRQTLAIAFAVGVRPCSGAILVLVFAIGQGLLWAGVFSTFAMALGAAITVSVLAVLAFGARDLAARVATFGSITWAGRLYQAAGLGGAGLVLALGATFFVVSLRSSRPF